MSSSIIFPRERNTPLPGGYMGKILRVDLTRGSFAEEKLPEEPMLRKFIGGQALALYILLRELPLDAKPYGVEGKLVMMTGPLTGTGFTPGGTKMTAVFLSPMTRYSLGRGATSGYWPVYLKQAGYDGIIVEGAASTPVYLFINDGKPELRDARRFWGKGARDHEKSLREAVGLKDAKVLAIGPAGEHKVHAAMLCNDYNHSASHSGGAILGSKNLKAIVVWGSARPPLYDKAALIEAGLRWRKTLQVYAVDDRRSVGHAGHLGALPNNNMQSSLIGDHNRGFDQNRIVQRPCFQCARLCPWDVEIGEGAFKGSIGHFNAGAEWMDTFWNLGVKGNATLYLAERINDLGIECGHFAFGAGVLFEAWQKGLVGADDTDGLRLEWGNVEAIDKLLEMTAHREGKWGNLIADGPLEVAEAIGGGAVEGGGSHKQGGPAVGDVLPGVVPGALVPGVPSGSGAAVGESPAASSSVDGEAPAVREEMRTEDPAAVISRRKH